MNRRSWLGLLGSTTLGGTAGCLDGVERWVPGGDDDGKDDSTAGSNASSTDRPRPGPGSAYVSDPDGDAAVSLEVDLGVGVGEPDAYEIAFQVSTVALSRASEDGGVRYDVDDTVALGRDDEGSAPLDRVLVDEEPIPVGTYDYLRVYGTVTAATVTVDENGSDGPDSESDVELAEGDHVEWSVGAVFESGDHKEFETGVAVDGNGGAYTVDGRSVATVTW